MKLLKLALVLSSLAITPACVEKQGEMQEGASLDSVSILADTAWRLVEIRSAGVQSGGQEVSASEVYTLRLQADGSVTLRLDCNRGFGRWVATPQKDGNAGGIKISDVGVTKAMCPPESISDRVTADLDSIANFALVDGSLLTFLEDGSTSYVWVPLDDADIVDAE